MLLLAWSAVCWLIEWLGPDLYGYIEEWETVLFYQVLNVNVDVWGNLGLSLKTLSKIVGTELSPSLEGISPRVYHHVQPLFWSVSLIIVNLIADTTSQVLSLPLQAPYYDCFWYYFSTSFVRKLLHVYFNPTSLCNILYFFFLCSTMTSVLKVTIILRSPFCGWLASSQVILT